MPAERFEIRIPASKLFIAMLLIVIPISFAGLFSLAQTDDALERTEGAQFKTIAQMSAAQVAVFIHERVNDARDLTLAFGVVDAVAAANRKYEGKSDAEIAAAVGNIEKIWNTPAADPLLRGILSSPAALFLRKHQQYDPRLLRITVTDIRGAVVAATHKTVDYFQADEEQWRNIYADGGGAVSITDIIYDDVTKSNSIGIGVPIYEEETNRLIGTLDALVDVSAIFPILREVQLGPTGRQMLVKEDGTVVTAPGVSTAAKMKAEEYGAIRDALGTVSGRQTGYIVATFKAGRQVIGFADTGLKDDYPKLGWAVIAAQDTREAFASVRTADWVLALMSVLGLLGVVLFGVYVYLHRQLAYEDLAEVAAAPVAASPRTEP
jgi:hypothetical protein